MDDDFYKQHAQRVRDLADKADPFTRKRLLDLADKYDAKTGKPSRGRPRILPRPEESIGPRPGCSKDSECLKTLPNVA
jgi:hypothetical protein